VPQAILKPESGAEFFGKIDRLDEERLFCAAGKPSRRLHLVFGALLDQNERPDCDVIWLSVFTVLPSRGGSMKISRTDGRSILRRASRSKQGDCGYHT